MTTERIECSDVGAGLSPPLVAPEHAVLTRLPGDTRLSPRDPDLDVLLLRFHLETGARRQGALGLRVADLDHARSTVWLHEKGNADREQPVAPTLLEHLAGFAGERGGQGV